MIMNYKLHVPLVDKLEEVRLDFIKTSNTLAYVTLGIGDISIDDVMCAYLITCEWCAWAKNPKIEGNPLKAEKMQKCDYTSLFNHMEDVRRQLEIKLTEDIAEVRDVFSHLSRGLVKVAVVLSINPNIPDVPEHTKRYYKRLAYTADFFKKMHGRDEFSNMLYGN